MAMEMEAKFRLRDPDAMRARLRAAGAHAAPAVLEHNTYFDTPEATLRRSGRGLRVRREQVEGGESRTVLTFKGPRLPGGLKIRQEEELSVNSAETAEALLRGLGFEPTLRFQKRRENYQLSAARVSLDELPGRRM